MMEAISMGLLLQSPHMNDIVAERAAKRVLAEAEAEDETFSASVYPRGLSTRTRTNPR